MWVTLSWAQTFSRTDVIVLDEAHMRANGYERTTDPEAIRDYLAEFPGVWRKQVEGEGCVDGHPAEQYVTGVEIYH